MSGGLCKSVCSLVPEVLRLELPGRLETNGEVFSSYLPCLHAGALNYLCSHSQVSQLTAQILFILPLVFLYLFNTCQFTNGFLFIILLIFSFPAKKQLDIESDLISVL